MAFAVEIPVRFRDLDGMGHVNNAVYFTYLEIARTEYYREMRGGIESLDEFEFILARAACDFKAPIGLSENVLVTVWPTRIGDSSFTFRYEIRGKETGTLFGAAETVQVAYDYQARKPIPIPPALRGKLEAELAAGPPQAARA